jgi:hypothetical protein
VTHQQRELDVFSDGLCLDGAAAFARVAVKALSALMLWCFLGAVTAAPEMSDWKQYELTEHFMRSLTKDQCMQKTIATLKNGCKSAECLKTLAGITGDCQTWGKGDIKVFCASYDTRYFAHYCVSNEVDGRSCWFLHETKPKVLCESKQ